MDKICVAVRVRPPISQYSCNGTYWKLEDNRISLQKSPGTPIHGYSYAFDHVFHERCLNARVYELLAQDIIHAAVEGFNGTAFAYGQTSSGKTFTMNGSGTNPGIVLLAIKDIFEKIQKNVEREFLVRVSYMEIYNEEIIDLLAIDNQKLQIKESLERGIFVAGLKEEIVSNAEQVLKLVELGEVNRHFGQTNMNAHSSRSHTIFRMVIESKGKDSNSFTCNSSSDAVRVSVLNLVDLAGSERIAKTGAGGVRLKEGKHINKSLLILGNVINKLSDGAKQKGHVPYRDSKLTRILQPALGGNAKTSIICTIAPEEVHVEETKGTLQFASRAKRITNCAKVNEILTDAALLKRQRLEIEELRTKLQGLHSGVQEQEILKLRNEMLKCEVEREKLEMELEEERKSHLERDQCIKEQQIKIDTLNSLVTFSDSEKNFSKGSIGHSLRNESMGSEGEVFTTPSFMANPNAFVVKRSNYSRLSDCSPLPDTSSTVADEDTWFKMNKGYIADLDSLHITPARKVMSLPARDPSPDCLMATSEEDVKNLRKRLEAALEEKNETEKNLEKHIKVNGQLLEEISNLQNKVAQTQLQESLHEELCESVVSTLEDFVTNDNSTAGKLLSSTREMSTSLFSKLKTDYFSDHEISASDIDLLREEHKLLRERLNTTIANLILADSQCGGKHEESSERYSNLERELGLSNQYLEDARERYNSLEQDFLRLKQERDDLLQSLSRSMDEFTLVTEDKEKISVDLHAEIQRRGKLEEEIKQFADAFVLRQSSFVCFNSDLRSKIGKIRTWKQESELPLKSFVLR